jgi:glycerophosphoryl diester phosphodiesterase
LNQFISHMPSISSDTTTVITSSEGRIWFQTKSPAIKTISVDSVKDCGMDYLLVGWAGIVPDSCRNTSLFIPPSKAKYFWGFPKQLAARLQKYGTKVYLWSEHNPVDPAYTTIVKDGVGVITSDLNFIQNLHTINDAK